MTSVNKVILLGRLGADPEISYTEKGVAFTKFSIATSRHWRDKDGDKHEATQWSKVIVWGKLAENCKKYLVRGQLAYVEGRLETSSWEDRDGNKRWNTEVVGGDVQFLDRPRGKSDLPAAQPDQQDFGDDGIPF